MSVEAVSKAVAAGRLPRSVVIVNGQPKIGDVDLANQEWEANTRPRIDHPRVPHRGPRSSGGDDGVVGEHKEAYDAARARRESALADLAEIEVAEKRDELVPFEEAREYMIEKFTVAKTKILGVPSRLAQQLPHLAAEVTPVLDALLREAMEEFAIDEDGGDGEEEDED